MKRLLKRKVNKVPTNKNKQPYKNVPQRNSESLFTL